MEPVLNTAKSYIKKGVKVESSLSAETTTGIGIFIQLEKEQRQQGNSIIHSGSPFQATSLGSAFLEEQVFSLMFTKTYQ